MESDERPDECQSCGCNAVLTAYRNDRTGKMQWYCEVCSRTPIAHMYEDPGLYSPDVNVMARCLAVVANMILDEIRKGRETDG